VGTDLFSPGRATVNSQGRKPLDRNRARTGKPWKREIDAVSGNVDVALPGLHGWWEGKTRGFRPWLFTVALPGLSRALSGLSGARTLMRGLCLCVLLVAAGCGGRHARNLPGTWETDLPHSPTFTFEADGSGVRRVQRSDKVETKPIRWRVDGNNLVVTVDGRNLGGLIKKPPVGDEMVVYDSAVNKNFTFRRVEK
jgi:hypothetical protein